MPNVVVVIPTRGRTDGLGRTLAGIGGPDGWAVTTVVVENGTCDAEHVARQHGALYAHLDAGNASRARNHGARLARDADVVAFLDDDAVPQEQWLERIAAPILRGDADATVGRCVTAFDHDVPDFVRAYFVDTDLTLDPTQPFLIGMNMAVQPRVLDSIGGFPERLGPGTPLGGGEDLLLTLQMRNAGHTIIAALDAVVRHEVPQHRVARGALRQRVAGAGRGEGWIAHHWFKARPWLPWLLLRLLRSRLLLIRRLPLQRELAVAERYWRERQMVAERLRFLSSSEPDECPETTDGALLRGFSSPDSI